MKSPNRSAASPGKKSGCPRLSATGLPRHPFSVPLAAVAHCHAKTVWIGNLIYRVHITHTSRDRRIELACLVPAES